jgi:hypothetical protein
LGASGRKGATGKIKRKSGQNTKEDRIKRMSCSRREFPSSVLSGCE